MEKLKFTSNSSPSVGIEIEMALVDRQTGALTNGIGGLLAGLPPEFTETVKPELMQCYVEVNSKTCANIDEAEDELRSKILAMQEAANASGVDLYWTGKPPRAPRK